MLLTRRISHERKEKKVPIFHKNTCDQQSEKYPKHYANTMDPVREGVDQTISIAFEDGIESIAHTVDYQMRMLKQLILDLKPNSESNP
jgi:hypothetical protein